MILTNFSRLKNTIPRQILKTIYNSLIEPHLSYAITSWGNINAKEMARLQLQQKQAIRCITKAKYNSHTNRLFRNLHILKIKDIFQLSCIKFYNKVKRNMTPIYFKQRLPQNSQLHSHFTRNSQNLHIFNRSTELKHQLIKVKIPLIWNSISEQLNCTSNLRTVYSEIKEFLISQYPPDRNIIDCYNC